MNRRGFLLTATGVLLDLGATSALANPLSSADLPEVNSFFSLARTIFVSPTGSDSNPGTESRPLKTFWAAQAAVSRVREKDKRPTRVLFRAGTYYLEKPVVFTKVHSGTSDAPIQYASYPGEEVIVSGGTLLAPAWTKYRDGILQTPVPKGTRTDQLFVNNERQILARYPNYDPNAKYLNGFSADATSLERAQRWSDPRGGYIHALHEYLWGDLHYQITGKDSVGNLVYEGGWQNNRPKPMHSQYRFIENVFEELDSPGEWYLNQDTNVLYFMPPPGMDMGNARVEVVRLKSLFEFRGTPDSPVRWISLRGFTFRHTARTFMETREPLLRSDWRIYRGGAVFFTGAEDCTISDSVLDQMGGNCIFVSNYNRRITVSGCQIGSAGANGVSFVGDPGSVRNRLDNYDQRLRIEDLDLTPGPQSNEYPADCLVEDTLIYQTGRVEKQSAPIEIDIAKSITVRHASIYDVPRAGINIGDGCWGGHRIEFCDVFDTVKETGDHGSFNSWGRDRWWGVTGVNLEAILDTQYKSIPLLDVTEPIVIANSRWRCDHGWDIDLDDGSTGYHIYNNLCLNGGLKLREGFYRICENNILVNNSLHAHVWFNDSRDVFRSNIVFAPYRPIGMHEWSEDIDFNLQHQQGQTKPEPARELQARSSRDSHSLKADANFVDPSSANFQVKPGSPALDIGFVNFDMDRFGVQSPRLKAIARQPEVPHLHDISSSKGRETRSRQPAEWAGAKVRNIVGLDEVSAAGTPGETGVILLDAPINSAAGQAGFLQGDVILAVDGANVSNVQDLMRGDKNGGPHDVKILRYQQESTIRITSK